MFKIPLNVYLIEYKMLAALTEFAKLLGKVSSAFWKPMGSIMWPGEDQFTVNAKAQDS